MALVGTLGLTACAQTQTAIAESVNDWLVKHGVKAAAISTKGYGETSPLAPNRNADGTDNIEGRQQNRRVAITVQK